MNNSRLAISIPHRSGSGIHLEHDRPAGGESGDRTTPAGHQQQLHDGLYDRVLDG